MEIPSPTTPSSSRRGLLLGALAVLFWAFGPSLVALGARDLPTWHFVCLAALIGGTTQMIFQRIHRGEVRSAILLPAKLWLVTLLCFVLYGLVFPWAVTLATSQPQLCAVTLINYLWPILTIVFGLLWVPHTRFSGRLLAALLLALAGLALANLNQIRPLLAAARAGDTPLLKSMLPYGLALAAAVSWAMYSSLLARWKSWARNYTTSAGGFLLIGLIAGLTSLLVGGPSVTITPSGCLMAVLYGLGPLGAGYLLWELALSRAKIQTLGLLGAVTPVLSLLLLCLFLRFIPGIEIVLAALLISGGVLLSL